MDKISICFLILCMVWPVLSKTTIYDVTKYGAKGDGKTDDSQAFLRAWKAACVAETVPTILIRPKKTFLLKPLTFNGPCKTSRVYVMVSGTLVAPGSKAEWKGYPINSWITFLNVHGLHLLGRGTIDGRGSAWWPNACLDNAPPGSRCKGPTALIIRRCDGFRLQRLHHLNSGGSHMIVTASNDVRISDIRITAPGNSPNTDGIDISSCKGVQIRNSVIGTGDDCIAIGGGSTNIAITGVMCGPGHGISIGALGHGGYDIVEEVHVKNCTLKDTTNGVRLKSWQGGTGYARKISFSRIRLVAVANPIIIDQFYCPHRTDCQNSTSAVAFSEISYVGIIGTSTTDDVIDLSCSQANSCKNIVLDHVYLASITRDKLASVKCFNAHGTASHVKPALNCLSK
ncbi:hypothetical protein Leryth_003069 [Lithospermum erythrorhizon]|nr:hypothetical protein Leryth_003069 [Lithospermum erythrorhizon]